VSLGGTSSVDSIDSFEANWSAPSASPVILELLLASREHVLKDHSHLAMKRFSRFDHHVVEAKENSQ